MSLRKTKDGRWRYRLLANGSKTGKYIQKTLPKGTTHSRAKELYRKAQAGAAARRGSLALTLTFAELAEQYLQDHGPKMAENSRDRADQILRLQFLPVFGHMVVDDIKARHIEAWQNERRSKAKASTVNREWNTMRAVLNYGQAKELIERNPIQRSAVKPLALERKGRNEFFEPDEWRRFLAVFGDEAAWSEYVARRREQSVARFTADGHHTGKGSRKADSEATRAYVARLQAMVPVFRTMFYTATRIGEVLSLTWSAVDLRRGTITITQHKTKRKVATPKTLPICAPLRAVLQSLPAGVGDALLFRKANGDAFDYIEIRRAFDKGVELAGITTALTPHSIRHTVGSWLTIAGHPERHVAEVLGHAQRSVTSLYSHLRERSLAPVLADLCRIESEGFSATEVTEVGAEAR